MLIFGKPNLFEVAQYLLFGVAKCKYIPTNLRIFFFLGSPILLRESAPVYD